MPRPHANQSTEELKKSLAAVSEQAAQFAQTGPKKFENAMHNVVDGLLDELERRTT